MTPRSIEIVGWDHFQHYKDRWPPWIKNYTELLANDDYLALTGHRRAILHGLWLAYAMSHGRLAHDTLSISRRLSLRVTTADLEALNHAGFIRFVASTSLAPHALARGREETETEEQQHQGSNGSSKERRTSSAPNYETTNPGDDVDHLFTNEKNLLSLVREMP